MAREEARAPQIIVAALPTIELCAESVKYGRERGVPVVLDMRDMWPDIFADAVPGPARPLARLLLWPMFRAARAACARATAITGITDEFVDWGLKRGRRQRSDLDRAFAMGYSVTPPSAEDVAAAEKFWDQQGVPAAGDGPIACFFGTLGRQFDMQTVLEAARLLQSQGGRVRFVLCGAGDRLDEFRTLASDLRNVYFPGWVDKAAIHVLMRRSMAGLDPLTDRYDFLATINNKAIEYLSAGLPIISSPGRGALNRLLSDERCGLSYEIGDAAGLAGVLSRLDREPELHASLADNARRVFLERFTADQVYGSMMEYLHEVVAGAKGRA
jgi:glycosyltransferase involved in cell wall biosynthesis